MSNSSSTSSPLTNLYMIKPVMEEYAKFQVIVFEHEVDDPRQPLMRGKLPGYLYADSRSNSLAYIFVAVVVNYDCIFICNTQKVNSLKGDDHLKLARLLYERTKVPVIVYAWRLGANSGYECVLQLGFLPKVTLQGRVWRWLTTQFGWMRWH